MSCVIDSYALSLLRYDENDYRNKKIWEILLEEKPCYITTTNVAEFYRIVHRVLPERVDYLLDLMLKELAVVNENDEELIRLAAELAEKCEVTYAAAFPAAYAKLYGLTLYTALPSDEHALREMEILLKNKVCDIEVIDG